MRKYDINFLLSRISIEKKKVIEELMLMVFVVLAYITIDKDLHFYILLHNVFVSSIVAAFVYVNIIKFKFANEIKVKRFRNLNFLSFIIIFLNILSIVNLFKYVDTSYFFFLCSIQGIFEYYQVAFLFELKKLDKNCLYLFFLELIMILVINNKSIIINYVCKEYFIMSCVCINSTISTLILISILKDINKNKSKLKTSVVNKILEYTASIILGVISFLAFKLRGESLAEVFIIIKFIIFYRFYNFIINKGLYESLDFMNKNMDKVIESKKSLNSILKKRNVILNETNIMIQKTQDKYNGLIDSIYGGVFLFSRNKLQYFNEKILNNLNIKSEDIKGINLEEFIKRYFDITLDNIDQYENYMPFANIKHNNLDVELYLIYVDDDNTLLYIQDITEKNEYKKIRKKFEEYMEVDKIKKQFFANISHELKTPINLIFSAIQINQLYIKENNLESIDKNRKIIQQNCLRLIRTINNFIDANKVSEGYIIPDMRVYNIVELVENASIACNKYIKLVENTLIFDADEEEIYVECDREMITRIMLNILSNSVKYGRKGGNIRVYVYSEDEENIVIKVRNDGPRIDKETIPYIFDKFTKLNKAFNRLKEGSGLGLFLTKALVELQGGEIRLISNNKSNEFIINMKKVKNIDGVSLDHEELEMNPLEEKVDTEFSDIYIE